MRKIAILCIFAVMLGAMPIYAADTNTAQQLQTDNPQLYQDLINLKNDILQNPDQIIGLLQNQDVQDQIHQWLQNSSVQDALNILLQNQDIKNDLNKLING